MDASILCHQVRTIDLRRVSALEIGGRRQIVSDPGIRTAVRDTLGRHLGLDMPPVVDGAP